MEDTLRVKLKLVELNLVSLNPCFNGRYSQRLRLAIKFVTKSLNPCFNGRYSQSHNKWEGKYKGGWVLILVLMEDTLRVVALLT